jgi:hypothetical protein
MLLGAVLAAWQGQAEAAHKRQVMQCLADHLGWESLRHDTARHEWKFNIWHFHDPTDGVAREARTLPVRLKYSMPAYNARRRTR